MPGEVKIEVLIGRAIYVLTRRECERVLALLDADAELGELLQALREDLRRALSGRTATAEVNPFADESDEPAAPWLAPKAETDAAPAASAQDAGAATLPAGTPVCYFCERPGVPAGAAADGMWRCETKGCLRGGAAAMTVTVFEAGGR
jgi:hypothetical protein